MPAETYRVRVSKESLVFSAAHFIVFNGICEPLHGHNYRVALDYEGELGGDHYVFDFVELERVTKAVTGALDHRVILPSNSGQIHVTQSGHEVTALFASRRWVFPSEDCVLLPIRATTAELLAAWIGRQVLAALPGGHGRAMRVEVEESPGAGGVWEWRA